jgi:hypothetical protein
MHTWAHPFALRSGTSSNFPSPVRIRLLVVVTPPASPAPATYTALYSHARISIWPSSTTVDRWRGEDEHNIMGGDGGGDVGRDGGGSVGEMVAATRGRRGEGVVGRWGRWHWGDGGVTCRETGTTIHCRRCSLPRLQSCSSCRRCRLHGGSLRRRYISSPPPFSQWFTGRRLTSPPLPLGALSSVYCSTPPLPRVGSTHVVHHLRGGERVHQFALSSPPPRTMHARIRGPLEQCHLVRFLLYQLSYIPNSLLNLRYNIICVFTTCPKRSSHGHQGPKRM